MKFMIYGEVFKIWNFKVYNKLEIKGDTFLSVQQYTSTSNTSLHYNNTYIYIIYNVHHPIYINLWM